MDVILDASGLCKTFVAGGVRRVLVPALSNISLHLRGGEILAVTGPNGAGKTTLLHVLLALWEPTAGRTLVFGDDPRAGRWRSRTGLGWFPPHARFRGTLGQFLPADATQRGMRKQEAMGRAEEIMAFLSLTKYANRTLEECPRGIQTLAAIARAILPLPPLLLLDDPAAALDAQGMGLVCSLLDELRLRNTAILLTGRSIGLLEARADRVAILQQGRILREGTPSEILPADAAFAVEVPRNPCLSPGWTFFRNGQTWYSTVNGDQQLGLLLRALHSRGFVNPSVIPIAGTPGMALRSCSPPSSAISCG